MNHLPVGVVLVPFDDIAIGFNQRNRAEEMIVGIVQIVSCVLLCLDLHQDLIQIIAIDIAAFNGIRIFRFRQDPPAVVFVFHIKL